MSLSCHYNFQAINCQKHAWLPTLLFSYLLCRCALRGLSTNLERIVCKTLFTKCQKSSLIYNNRNLYRHVKHLNTHSFLFSLLVWTYDHLWLLLLRIICWSNVLCISSHIEKHAFIQYKQYFILFINQETDDDAKS